MRHVVRFLVSLPFFLFTLTPHALPVAASGPAFSFNWTGTPTAPQQWAPGRVNDWDLIANIDAPTDTNGSMSAGHGTGCEPPPATHPVSGLADSAFLCKNHMMTAINGGDNAATTYGAVYFTPAQMMDWSQGPSTLTWKVSTARLSSRDWWQVDLSPFGQSLVLPLLSWLPAYEGEAATGLEMKLDDGTCNQGRFGSIIKVYDIAGGDANEITQHSPCVEDTVPPSFTARSQFEVDVSATHLKVFMPGTTTVWFDGPISLPFKKAVVQFSHHSYNPQKGENPDGSGGLPNTYHWSDVSISPSAAFTMLRPPQPFSLHGQDAKLTLPQPAPQNAFLRFAGIGNFQVSFNGGISFQPARVLGSIDHPEHFASFWTPAPAGTTQVVIRGQPNSYGQPWWVEDVSVWAHEPVPVTGTSGSAGSSGAQSGPGSGTVSPAGGDPLVGGHEVLKSSSGPAVTAVTAAMSAQSALPGAPATGGGFLGALAHRVTPPSSSFWPGFLAGVLLALVGAGGALLWTRRRRRAPAGPPRA